MVSMVAGVPRTSKRAANPLTARRADKERKPGMHADGGGLYLRIGSVGARSWIFRYQVAGIRHDMGLGFRLS